MMRHYYIYLIEEEFANHYFGRESKIYHLFLEFDRTSVMYKKKLLKMQIDYVTKPIHSLRIHQLIETQLKKRTDYYLDRNAHVLLQANNRSHAKLVVHDRYLSLQANGNYEAETIFFEILRKENRCFLAMDLQMDRYGWLAPIKERKFV